MSKNIQACFSHKSDEWETPRALFDNLDQEFNFDIDLCASKNNALCKKYYTKEYPLTDKGSQLLKGHSIFCNPPYSNVGYFVELCWYLAFIKHNTCVMLIPSRTDTKWFHKYICNNPCCQIRFIKGRLKFCHEGKEKQSAPFPSMIVVFRGR